MTLPGHIEIDETPSSGWVVKEQSLLTKKNREMWKSKWFSDISITN